MIETPFGLPASARARMRREAASAANSRLPANMGSSRGRLPGQALDIIIQKRFKNFVSFNLMTQRLK